MVVATYCNDMSEPVAVSVAVGSRPRALTPFLFEQVDTQWWRLTADFLWWDGKRIIRCRRGYGWNGASVPVGARWYCTPGDYLAASCLHDYGYGFHWLEVWDAESCRWRFVDVTKSEMDALWWQVLGEEYRTRISKRFVLWEAVALGGWYAWWIGGCHGNCKSCDPLDQGRDCPYLDFPPTKDEFIKRI